MIPLNICYLKINIIVINYHLPATTNVYKIKKKIQFLLNILSKQ